MEIDELAKYLPSASISASVVESSGDSRNSLAAWWKRTTSRTIRQIAGRTTLRRSANQLLGDDAR